MCIRDSFTPLGTGISFLPTRDIENSYQTRLPNVTQHFAADTFFAGAMSGHDPARRGQNINSQAAQNARHSLRTHVNAAAGTRHALNARDHRHVARRVLEIDADGPLGAILGELV